MTETAISVPAPAQVPVVKARDVVIDHKDLAHLVKFLGPQGQIQSRKRTAFSAQRQKALKLAIKRSRHLALLPFVG